MNDALGKLSSKTGTVKWFDSKKGYGFLVDQNGQDIFAHYKQIREDGYRTLTTGMKVSFDIISTPKGLSAVNIKLER